MEVKWTKEALEGLENIQHYLLNEKEDPTAARNAAIYIIDRLPQIGDMPLSGQQVPGYADSKIRWILEKDYRIIYYVADDACYLLSIMYQYQLLPKIKELRKAANDAVQAYKLEAD